jgi:4-hydroxy-3-methylbut-2-enyl diphosphate reductase
MSSRTSEAGKSLLIAAPLRIEARALRRGARNAHVVRTGMGPERARRAVAGLRGHPAERVVVAGFCGALEESLEPGQVVVASELRGMARQVLEVPPGLVEALEGQGLDVCVAPLACVPRVARGGDRLVLRAGGARAVDMESAWLAPCAVGRPFAVVRVVLDGPRHELLRPAFARNLLRAARCLRSVGRALDLWAQSQPSRKSTAGIRAAATGEA